LNFYISPLIERKYDLKAFLKPNFGSVQKQTVTIVFVFCISKISSELHIRHNLLYTSLHDPLSVFVFPKNQSFDCGIYSIAYQHAVYDWPVRNQKALKKEKKAEENPRHGVKS
jgi:hypothetical protein